MDLSYDHLDVSTVLYDELIDNLGPLPDQTAFDDEAYNVLEDQADNYPYILREDWPSLIADMWELYLKDQQ